MKSPPTKAGNEVQGNRTPYVLKSFEGFLRTYHQAPRKKNAMRPCCLASYFQMV